jgi:hypothetical protein
MTPNQLHGKRFEDQIKGCGWFDRSADSSRAVNAGFDIEARFDRRLSLPTSIKSTGSKTIALADARKFWSIAQPYRMLVGSYNQDNSRKVFNMVHEFIIHGAILELLRGRVAVEEVAQIHTGLGLQHFPEGRHNAARLWAREQIASIQGRLGLAGLNPKIDSRSQRRLQCSVSLDVLIAAATGETPFYDENNNVTPNHQVHDAVVGTLVLPVTLLSSRRAFRQK